MTHLDEGTLQAFLDDELSGERRAEVAEHLLACEDCQAMHEELRHANALFGRAVSLLDAEPVAGSASAPARSQVRRGVTSFVRAAMLILALAAAASAAVPGSPVRAWITETLAPEQPPVEPGAPPPVVPADEPRPAAPAGVYVPAGGERVVRLASLEGTAIRLVRPAGDRIGVSVTGADRDPVFRTGPAGIEVRDGGGGAVTVRFPAEGHVRLEVDGRLYAESTDGALRIHVPGDTTSGSVVWR